MIMSSHALFVKNISSISKILFFIGIHPYKFSNFVPVLSFIAFL